MTDKWAYTQLGRLHHVDIHDFFGPVSPSAPRDPLLAALYEASRREFWKSKQSTPEVTQLIGFDGTHWISGMLAKPTHVLDSARYPREFGCDQVGRPIHHFHGYLSKSAAFPDHLPFVDPQRFVHLHETNILPHWETESYNVPHTLTTFETVADSVSLRDLLPDQAIEALRKAHADGTPIAVRFDATTKQWDIVGEGFERDILKRKEKEAGHFAQYATESKAAETAPARTTERLEKGWLAKLWEHPGGKFAIIGGTVALGATIGYWAFRVRHQTAKEDARASGATRSG